MSKPNTFEVFSNYELPPFNNIEYFLILDTSSSMGNYIPQIIQKVIPEALSKIDYPEKKPFHLITFSNFCSHSILTRKEFPYVSIEGKGETHINLVFPKLKNILNSFPNDYGIFILTISDGKTNDEIKKKMEQLINESNKNIESKAIRFIPNLKEFNKSNSLKPNDNNSLKRADTITLMTYDSKNKTSIEVKTFNANNINMSDKEINDFAKIIADDYSIKAGWKCYENKYILPFGIHEKTFEDTETLDKVLKNLQSNNQFIKDKNNQNNTEKKIDTLPQEDITNNNYKENKYKESFKIIMKKIIDNKKNGNKERNEWNKNLIEYFKSIEKNRNDNFAKVLNDIENDSKINNLSKKETINYINDNVKKCDNQLKEINKKTEEKELQKKEFILLIDTSKEMENYINKVKNILIQTLTQIGEKLNSQIRFYGFNSEEFDEHSFRLEKFQKYKINCLGERILFNSLKNLCDVMISKPFIEYEIITFTSGQILDEKEVRILAYKMKELNKYINIKSKVIYYDIGEDVSINDSIITCGLIKLISRVQPKDVLPLQLDMNDSDEVNIKKIIGYIQSDN